jgi:8-oxo-dGTP diphosphatase
LVSDGERLRVVAAALLDGTRVLIAERPAGKHMAGWWEFPGGKVAAGESDGEALVRELREELDVEVRPLDEVARLRHDYPDRQVEVILWHAVITGGTPRGLDGQRFKWVDTYALGDERLLEADRPFIAALQALSSRRTL